MSCELNAYSCIPYFTLCVCCPSLYLFIPVCCEKILALFILSYIICLLFSVFWPVYYLVLSQNCIVSGVLERQLMYAYLIIWLSIITYWLLNKIEQSFIRVFWRWLISSRKYVFFIILRKVNNGPKKVGCRWCFWIMPETVNESCFLIC